MEKLIATGFKDRENNTICLGDTVITEDGREFLITLDSHLGYSLYDTKTHTLEQLNVFNSKQILAVYVSPSLPYEEEIEHAVV